MGFRDAVRVVKSLFMQFCRLYVSMSCKDDAML